MAQNLYKQAVVTKTTLPEESIVPAQNNQQQGQQAQIQQALGHAQRHLQQGQLVKAEKILTQVLQAVPNQPFALNLLGVVAHSSGKPRVAMQLINRAIQINDKVPLFHANLSEMLRQAKAFQKAINHGKKAVALDPNMVAAHSNMGIAYFDLQDYNKAQACHEKALRLNPNFPPSLNNMGSILSERGELKKAKEFFLAAVKQNPLFLQSHYNYSTIHTYTENDPHLASLEHIKPHIHSLPDFDQVRYWFALGKAYENTNKNDEAFKAYGFANGLHRKSFHYDIATPAKRFQNIMSKYDQSFADKDIKGNNDDTPVFIVGMPRSGTSLIEQVLSSHSQVFGAGELTELPRVVNATMEAALTNKDQADELEYVDWLIKAKDEDVEQLGRLYIESLRSLDNKALKITDKLPGNFLFIGLIHKAMPNAKIIHAVRHPYDTCISNYSRLFTETMPFAYDLTELGTYYQLYSDLMDHWKTVLPQGVILDVSYEDMVDDLEAQSKRLVEHCGLEWENECLEFYNTKRYVKTASVSQVRQPIYKSSVEKWKRYEKHLEPLKSVLTVT